MAESLSHLGILVSPSSVSVPLGFAGALCAAHCCSPRQREEGGQRDGVEAEPSGVTTSLGGFGPVVLWPSLPRRVVIGNWQLGAGEGGRGGSSGVRGAGLPLGCFETPNSPRPPPRTAEGAAGAAAAAESCHCLGSACRPSAHTLPGKEAVPGPAAEGLRRGWRRSGQLASLPVRLLPAVGLLSRSLGCSGLAAASGAREGQPLRSGRCGGSLSRPSAQPPESGR